MPQSKIKSLFSVVLHLFRPTGTICSYHLEGAAATTTQVPLFLGGHSQRQRPWQWVVMETHLLSNGMLGRCMCRGCNWTRRPSNGGEEGKDGSEPPKPGSFSRWFMMVCGSWLAKNHHEQPFWFLTISNVVYFKLWYLMAFPFVLVSIAVMASWRLAASGWKKP